MSVPDFLVIRFAVATVAVWMVLHRQVGAAFYALHILGLGLWSEPGNILGLTAWQLPGITAAAI